MAHVGNIGERKYVFVKCTKTRTFTNRYGYHTALSHMNFLEDRFGNVFVYKGTTILRVGHYYGMKATIKSHEVYQDVQQTWLGRPKFELHKDENGVVVDDN